MGTCQTVRHKPSTKYLRHLHKKHAPEQKARTDAETALPAEPPLATPAATHAATPATPDDYTTETVQEDKMTSETISSASTASETVTNATMTSQAEKVVLPEMPVLAAQPRQAGMAGSRTDIGMFMELDLNALDNMAMNFLEGAEAEFTYHQAELIRLAYLGLNTENAIQAAQFVLDRARRLAPNRPGARKIDDPFNEYISDFVEQASGHLSYVEAEIIRRAARGCDNESIDELQYLLNRALKALHACTVPA